MELRVASRPRNAGGGKEGLAVAKTVLPSLGQAHEFFRQIGDRVGPGLVQLAVEDPDPVARFIREHYGRRFSPSVREALKQAGYEIIRVPGRLSAPVTLQGLYRARDQYARGSYPRTSTLVKFVSSWHGDFGTEEIEHIEFLGGDMAWMPDQPLIPESMGENTVGLGLCIGDYSRQVQVQFGRGVKAVTPTAEQVLCLLFDYFWRWGSYPLDEGTYSYVRNRYRSRHLVVGCASRGGLIVGEYCREVAGDTGVLRLVVPQIDK